MSAEISERGFGFREWFRDSSLGELGRGAINLARHPIKKAREHPIATGLIIASPFFVSNAGDIIENYNETPKPTGVERIVSTNNPDGTPKTIGEVAIDSNISGANAGLATDLVEAAVLAEPTCQTTASEEGGMKYVLCDDGKIKLTTSVE